MQKSAFWSDFNISFWFKKLHTCNAKYYICKQHSLDFSYTASFQKYYAPIPKAVDKNVHENLPIGWSFLWRKKE